MRRPPPSTKRTPRAFARHPSSFWLVSSFVILISSFSSVQGADSRWVDRIAFWSWSELETLSIGIHQREQQLATLPELMLINSCLRIGLKTGYTTEEDVRWFELTLKEAASVDSIVLVPPLVYRRIGAALVQATPVGSVELSRT